MQAQFSRIQTKSTIKPQDCTTLYSDHKNLKMAQNSLSFNPTMRLSNLIKAYHKMPPVTMKRIKNTRCNVQRERAGQKEV